MTAWAIVRCVHVTPLDDLIQHELSPACACQPAEQLVRSNDGSDTFMFTHSSLDGRELSEPDRTSEGTPP